MLESLNPIWVASADDVSEVADACSAAGRFSLDTEADSLHSYFHKVCLLQVTAGDRHFLLDPLMLSREVLHPLLEVMADPAVPVLMHGADYDVRVLDRDLGGRLAGLEDTQIMAQLLGEPRTGLAALLERDVGVTLDKRYQRADWGQRPLPPQLLAYAAADTAFLETLAGRLRPRLEALGRWSWAEEEFARLEAVRFVPPEADPLAFERLRGARGLKGTARDRVFTLHRWREERAQELDVPPFRVMANGPLVAVAEEPPDDTSGLARVDGLGPRFVRRWGREVLRQLSRPQAAPPRARRTGGGRRRSSSRRGSNACSRRAMRWPGSWASIAGWCARGRWRRWSRPASRGRRRPGIWSAADWWDGGWSRSVRRSWQRSMPRALARDARRRLRARS